jgi:hypothetical protein
VLGSSFVQAHSLASASAVLPFLGVSLGGAPISRCRPRRCSHSSALAVLPFLGVGLGNAPIPRRRPRPRLFLGVGLGGAPIPRRRPRQCSHSSALASPSVLLLLGSSASLLPVRFWLIVECCIISKIASDSHLHSSLFILSFLLFLLSFYGCVFSILPSIATKY